MRVVVDTNVLVSGMLNPGGAPGRVVELMLSETLVVLYDLRVLSEYTEVLTRPELGLPSDEVASILNYILRDGEQVAAAALDLLLPDATDRMFIEVAVGGCADALITGNARHFKPRRGHHSVNVISPAEFLLRLA